MDYHSRCIMHEIRDLAGNICLYEKGEEETRHFLVLPVFTDILNIDKCSISLASSGGGKSKDNDISKRIDVLVRRGSRTVFVTEVKSLVYGEFNFFNVFNGKDIGKVWFVEKNNGAEKGIWHTGEDGTAQLRSYSAILYFSNKEKDFYPIFTNGFFWVLFKKKFYNSPLQKISGNKVEFEYLGKYLKNGYRGRQKKELYPKIQPCLNSVKYITSVFADKDGFADEDRKIEKIKEILGKYKEILEKVKGDKDKYKKKIEEIKEILKEVKNGKKKIEEIKEILKEIKKEDRYTIEGVKEIKDKIKKIKKILDKINKDKKKIEEMIRNVGHVINDEELLNKIKNKFISFEKFIEELKNIYEGA